MKSSMNSADWSLLIVASIFLGSTFLFLNIAVTEISPLTAAALRTLIAAPFCWILMRTFGARLPSTFKGWIPLFCLGLLTAAIPFGTIAWGQQYIESGVAGIFYGAIPVMTVVLAPVFLAEETFTRRRLTGAAVGLIGVVLVIGPTVLNEVGNQLLAVLISFLAPVSHTLGAIYARRLPNIAPPAMATGQMIFGAAILVPLAFIVETPLSLTPGTEAIGAMLITGTACTAVAMSLYFIVVRRVGATRGSLMALFMPIVAVLLGALVLNERLSITVFFGLALILIGALAVSGNTTKKEPLNTHSCTKN